MIARIEHKGRHFSVDLSKPIDLSLPVHDGDPPLRAWWVDPVRMEPVRVVDADGKETVYSIEAGAPVNFRNIRFNPHGHGTHTESVGHIAPEIHPVGRLLPDGKEDHVVTLEQLRNVMSDRPSEALVLRTLPHRENDEHHDWSGTNPCYIQSTACSWLRSIGVKHLLLDLPSVDREEDGGELAAHHAFWDFPSTLDLDRTITELLHVPREVRDGEYLLELQLANFTNDAAPSRPVLYALLP